MPEWTGYGEDDVCNINKEGRVYISEDFEKPKGFCPLAWHAIFPWVNTLRLGGSFAVFHGESGAEKGITCCSDGLHPVIFKLERI